MSLTDSPAHKRCVLDIAIEIGPQRASSGVAGPFDDFPPDPARQATTGCRGR